MYVTFKIYFSLHKIPQFFGFSQLQPLMGYFLYITNSYVQEQIM